MILVCVTEYAASSAPTPPCVLSALQVRHDNTVTWLAYWKDPVNEASYKYVWLAANSTFKSESDLAKYEKARKLKEFIGPIR